MIRKWSETEWNIRRAALKLAVERAVYEAAVRHFENAENAGILSGNGHHAAQRLAGEAAKAAAKEWDLRRPLPTEDTDR